MRGTHAAACWRVAFAVLMGVGLSLATRHVLSPDHRGALTYGVAEASGKNCACPIMPGETIVIPCSSQLDPTSCGVCSVLAKNGKRDGRSCITIQ